MQRRSFISASTGAAALLGASCAPSTDQPASQPGTSPDIGSIGAFTIDQVRSRYEADLLEDYVPFHDKYVVDMKTGCYYAATNNDGTHDNTNTSSSYMGRGIWCYSFLYNNIEKNDHYLDIASKGVEFIMKHRPTGDNLWSSNYTNEGAVMGSGEGSWPGDCYIAEGLAEYSRASGDTKYFDVGRETILKCARLYDRPDFKYGDVFPGSRNIWYTMLLMWFGTNVLYTKNDPEMQALNDHSRNVILENYNNPKFNLMNLLLNHDYSRCDDPKHAELAGCGHATEATWMILYEAVRRKDKALFDRTAEVFRRHAVVSRDDVYGGYFNDCTDVDKNIWELTKISWAQAFILMNSLYIVEHTGLDWAKDIFSDQFTWALEHLPLKKHGFALWMEPRDRFCTFVEKSSRKDNYHHPRHLMLNVMSARRMSERKGKLSGAFG